MTIKRGRIVRVGRVGRKFVQADLDNGERVEIPIPLMDDLSERFSLTTDDLVFIEAKGRAFTYVQWVGSEQEFEALGTTPGQYSTLTRPVDDQPARIAAGGGIGPRLVWYLVVSGAVIAAIIFLNLPQWVLIGYLAIAAIGLVLAIRDNS